MNFLETIENLGFSTWVREEVVAYPTILWFHVMGMGVVAGVSALISLRLLGIAPRIPLRPLDGLYKVMWWGFWVNAATGTALLMSEATSKLVDPTFYAKMVFIFLGVMVLRRTRVDVFAKLGPNGEAPDGAKKLAWAGLICWTGAITAGRLLAYI